MASKKGLLERLAAGVVVGDGGFTVALEKRGYVLGGAYTPEAVIEKPEAVANLHREFLDAGSDVLQAFTFYASEDKLNFGDRDIAEKYTCAGINIAACSIAQRVAAEGDALVAAGLSQTPSYEEGASKKTVQAEFQKQVNIFLEKKVDFIVAEYFQCVEEIEWAIEVCLSSGLPVMATMCIGPQGDLKGVDSGQCAVRMARAGAHVVGVNCQFGPSTSLDTIRKMKEALDAAGLKPYLAAQPVGYHVPDAGKGGYVKLPEFPFAMESRQCSRSDIHRYARKAYELGVRYIGGCCGFEAYHIRAISEELANERPSRPTPFSSSKHVPWGGALGSSVKAYVRERSVRSYWENLQPSTGRPYSASLSTPSELEANLLFSSKTS